MTFYGPGTNQSYALGSFAIRKDEQFNNVRIGNSLTVPIYPILVGNTPPGVRGQIAFSISQDRLGYHDADSWNLVVTADEFQSLQQTVAQNQTNQQAIDAAQDERIAALEAGAAGSNTQPVIDDAPVGQVTFYGGVTPPPGWVLTDGATYDTATYPELAGVLGTRYNTTATGTQFQVPNLNNRYARGAPTQTALGTSGGSNTHTLTVPELATHNHGLGGHTHNVPLTTTTSAGASSTGPYGLVSVGPVTGSTQVTTSAPNEPTTSTNNTGSSTPFSILDPFLYLTGIIKALPFRRTGTAPAVSPSLPAEDGPAPNPTPDPDAPPAF